MKKQIIVAIGLCFMQFVIFAQSTIPVCGGSSVNSSGSMSYSVGQVDYISTSSKSGSVIAGVQQPFDENIIYQTNCDGVEISVHPNPTSDYVNVSCDAFKVAYPYVLFDLTGKLLLEGTLSGDLTKISMRQFNDGAYILKIICGEGKDDFSSFKIIVKK